MQGSAAVMNKSRFVSIHC